MTMVLQEQQKVIMKKFENGFGVYMSFFTLKSFSAGMYKSVIMRAGLMQKFIFPIGQLFSGNGMDGMNNLTSRLYFNIRSPIKEVPEVKCTSFFIDGN